VLSVLTSGACRPVRCQNSRTASDYFIAGPRSGGAEPGIHCGTADHGIDTDAVRTVHSRSRFAIRAHGHMTDRTGYSYDRHGSFACSAAILVGRAKRSVKPSAQPTQVRTLHLPLPAQTARGLGISGLAGRLAVVMMCRREPLHSSDYGQMADGIGPEPAVRRTAGFPDCYGQTGSGERPGAVAVWSGLREIIGDSGRLSAVAVGAALLVSFPARGHWVAGTGPRSLPVLLLRGHGERGRPVPVAAGGEGRRRRASGRLNPGNPETGAFGMGMVARRSVLATATVRKH
jgi:hypothetical protein